MASLYESLKAIQEELMRGKKVAELIGSRMQGDHEINPLVEFVIGSFSRALSCMDPANLTVNIGLTSSGEEKGETSSIGKAKASDTLENCSRGNYRKRKPGTPWRQITSKSIADGYKWKKYGKKEIKGSTYPRSYFNCYHKEKGCKATKLVQRTNDDVSDDANKSFVMTYIGDHTCSLQTASENLQKLSSLQENSVMSIGSTSYDITQDASIGNFNGVEVESNDYMGYYDGVFSFDQDQDQFPFFELDLSCF